MKRISVVTVTYNCKDLIESTMISVSRQNPDLVEHLIVDGGSSDGTVETINIYRDKLAYFVSEPDNGIYDAMNKGILAATGEWLIFLNAGDVFHPNFYFDNLTFNWPDKAEFIAFPFTIEGSPKPSIPSLSCRMMLPSSHQATLISARTAKQNLFNTNYIVAADFDQFKRRQRTNPSCVHYESCPIVSVKADGFSAKNIKILQSEYSRILFHHDGLLLASIYYIINMKSTYKLIRLLTPNKLFQFARNNLNARFSEPE